jgi:hypothetical protein
LFKGEILAETRYRPLRAKGAVFLSLTLTILLISCAPSSNVNLQIDSEVLSLATNTKKLPISLDEKNGADIVAAMYQNPGTKRAVIDFFSGMTKNSVVATAILDNSVNHRIPASLAFAIAYEESKFDPKAKNLNSGTVDRGLFQLNSSTFPTLTEKDAYDPYRNAQEGLSFFKHILDISGNEISALAMFNAGRTRVSQKGAPIVTLDYISRIMTYERNISSLFVGKVVARTSLIDRIKLGAFASAR